MYPVIGDPSRGARGGLLAPPTISVIISILLPFYGQEELSPGNSGERGDGSRGARRGVNADQESDQEEEVGTGGRRECILLITRSCTCVSAVSLCEPTDSFHPLTTNLLSTPLSPIPFAGRRQLPPGWTTRRR